MSLETGDFLSVSVGGFHCFVDVVVGFFPVFVFFCFC